MFASMLYSLTQSGQNLFPVFAHPEPHPEASQPPPPQSNSPFSVRALEGSACGGGFQRQKFRQTQIVNMNPTSQQKECSPAHHAHTRRAAGRHSPGTPSLWRTAPERPAWPLGPPPPLPAPSCSPSARPPGIALAIARPASATSRALRPSTLPGRSRRSFSRA